MKLRSMQLYKQAEKEFLKDNYKKAFDLYSKLLKANNDIESKIGLILSDMALNEDKKRANILFELFILTKDNNESLEELLNIISSYDENNILFNELMNLLSQEIEFEDGINFKDFKEIVKNNDKSIIENILFSTKILVENKEELIELLDILISFSYKELAMLYLEEVNSQFPNDIEIKKLFEKLAQKDDIKNSSIKK